MKAALGLLIIFGALATQLPNLKKAPLSHPPTKTSHAYRTMLAVSAMSGLLAAPFGPNWNRTMDLALFQSGQVSYPSDSPMAQYWATPNLPARILSWGFRLRIPDWLLAFASNLVLVAIGSFAVAMLIYGLCNAPLWSAVVSSLMVLLPRPLNIFGYFFEASAHTYPALPWTTQHTLGLLAFYLLLLCLALDLNGRKGAALAVGCITVLSHPVFGVVALSINIATRASGSSTQPFRSLTNGIALLVASGTVAITTFWFRSTPLSETDKYLSERFIALWDGHRYANDSLRLSVIASCIFTVSLLAIFILLTERSNVGRRATLLVFLLFSLGSLCLYVLQVSGPELPFVPIITKYQLARLTLVSGYFNVVALAACTRWALRGRAFPLSNTLRNRYKKGPWLALGMVLAIAPLVQIGNFVPPSTNCPKTRPELYFGTFSTSLSLYRACRWPVALDISGLDFVPYLPGTAAAINDLLFAGYGLTFDELPTQYQHTGSLPDGAFQDTWARRSLTEWRQTSAKTGIQFFVAPDHWDIQLPPFAQYGEENIFMIRQQGTEVFGITD